MNYPQLMKHYERIIDKFYPIDFSDPSPPPKLEEELNHLVFLMDDLDLLTDDITEILANILWDIKRLNDLRIKEKILEKQKLKNEVRDILCTFDKKIKKK